MRFARFFEAMIPAERVLQQIQSSPQMQADRDWNKYAERWGVVGDFVEMELSVPDLIKKIQDRHLGISQSLSQDAIQAKIGEPLNVVIIAKPSQYDPRGSMFILDGSHSLIAASQSKQPTIRAWVSQELAQMFKDMGAAGST